MPGKLPASAKDLDLGRLCEGYRAARLAMKSFRKSRTLMAERVAGDNFSETTAATPRPVNTLSLACRIMPRSVVPKEPRVSFSVTDPALTRTAKAEEKWVNEEFERMNIGAEFRKVFLDALLQMGIMKVALCSPGTATLSGYAAEAGKPFAERIDLDAFAYEHTVADIRRAGWYSHLQRVPLEALKETKLYDAAVRKKIEAQTFHPFTEIGEEKAQTLGPGLSVRQEAFDYAQVVEFYLPRHKLVVTLLADEAGNVYADDVKGENGPLDIREWVGPDCGPYHFLILQDVPNNAQGKGPLQDIATLDEHFNAVVTKLIQQAGRQKENLIVDGGADKDAERIVNAADGEAIRVNNPDKIKSVAHGGPAPNNQQFAIALWDLINKMGGNIEAMGGLGAQASTATQEKIINANSSAMVTDMQELMLQLISAVASGLCWYYHYHPELVMKTAWAPKSIPTMTTPTPVYPWGKAPKGARERNFHYEELGFRIDPYSLQHQTPSSKLQFIIQVVTQIWTPLAPLFQQAGVSLDANGLFDLLAELSGVSELSQVIQHNEPPQPDQQGGGDATEPPHDRTLPVQTSRTYNRVNPSAQTQSGQRTAVQQLLGSFAAKNGNGSTTQVGR